MKTVNGTTDAAGENMVFFVDIEGDIFDTKSAAEVCGLAGEVIVDSFFVGSLDDMRARALRIYNSARDFKVGYYQADTINGVFYIGTALDDTERDMTSPSCFEASLKDLTDDEIIVAYFDQSDMGLLVAINAKYGIK